MELSDAIQRAVIQLFNPEYLNPLSQVFIYGLDEVLLLEGWDAEKRAWKLYRTATDENELKQDTVIYATEIGDPYMALRVASLYGRQHRIFLWETSPMDLRILIPIKERVDKLVDGGIALEG